MTEGKRSLLVLISTMSMNREQVQNQSRAITMLEAKKIPFSQMDGADPSMKERRNELFKMSGIRGNYPQFFLVEDGHVTFLGDWEKIEAVNDASSLPDDILEANPSIMTWEKVLGELTPAS